MLGCIFFISGVNIDSSGNVGDRLQCIFYCFGIGSIGNGYIMKYFAIYARPSNLNQGCNNVIERTLLLAMIRGFLSH